MIASPQPQPFPWTASSIVEVLFADEEITDAAALTAADAPEWLRQLGIPRGWQLVELSDNPHVPLVRMAVHGRRRDTGWEAAETISVFTYTGSLILSEVFSNAAGTLNVLGAADIVTKVLPIPRARWTVALRSSGNAVIGARLVWLQQSNYVAGSEQPHAGRLIVHSVFVDSAYRDRLAGDVAEMSDAVYRGFIAALPHRYD